MSSLTHPYTDDTQPSIQAAPRLRTGSPPRRASAPTRYEYSDYYVTGGHAGSHMPIDTDAHWHWRNPLNLLPALLLALLVLALLALVWPL